MLLPQLNPSLKKHSRTLGGEGWGIEGRGSGRGGGSWRGGGLKETRNFDDKFSCGTVLKEGLLQKMALILEEMCS